MLVSASRLRIRSRCTFLAYRNFLIKYKRCYDAAFPLREKKTKRKKLRKPWVTRYLYKKIKEKNSKYHAFIKTRDPRLLAEFKKFRNELNRDLKKAKCDYFQAQFQRVQDDHRKVWDTINNLITRKQRCTVKEIVIDNVTVAGKELADAMNQHFISIGSYAGNDSIAGDCTFERYQLGSIMLAPTTPFEIDKIIRSLENDVAAGDDEIKALPIKYTTSIISPVLSHIVNNMLQSGDFPDELKIAKITPVYKGGGENLINNYRPISVLPAFSKIFERVINDRLTSFLQKHQIITPEQYGFQKKKVCGTSVT